MEEEEEEEEGRKMNGMWGICVGGGEGRGEQKRESYETIRR